MPKIKCGVCSAENYTVIYDGVIRDGAFGKDTRSNRQVVKCESCGLVRLLDQPQSSNYYQSDEYRKSYNNTAKAADYISMHDSEQLPRFRRMDAKQFRNQVVLDYGCGGGAFLDWVKGVSTETIGIEPYQGYHESIVKRGHKVFKDSESALEKYRGKIDMISSFYVIEHVEDPVQFLKDGYDLLKEGGSMYIETNNLNDILMELESKEYERFFYRTAHLWYFDSTTLKKASEMAGFSNAFVSFRQIFDLSNAMLWLRDGVPTGNSKLKFLDSRINSSWATFLESTGMSDTVCIEMIKN
jgi:2-polyprenyl-3-methyl-5-hydroxy-6-metoxy-1,4-benzoquinol methylase